MHNVPADMYLYFIRFSSGRHLLFASPTCITKESMDSYTKAVILTLWQTKPMSSHMRHLLETDEKSWYQTQNRGITPLSKNQRKKLSSKNLFYNIIFNDVPIIYDNMQQESEEL